MWTKWDGASWRTPEAKQLPTRAGRTLRSSMLPKFSRNQEDLEANCRVISVSCRDPAQEQDRVEGPSKELSFHKPPQTHRTPKADVPGM